MGIVSYILAAAGTTDLAKLHLTKARKDHLERFLTLGERITFPVCYAPRATIVIPAHNHAYHTLECLLSLVPMAGEWLEVLVCDDCSTDCTQQLLSRCDNITVLRNPVAQGFLKTVNLATKAARGRFIILLNNDARVVEGSIQDALDLFESEPKCGLMGARVVHVNGGLQEAGCMIFQDGNTNGYLRYQSKDDPRAMFIRDVDYCSGVFAIVEKDQFLSMGGFDEAFAPAYFEDTDFCMRLRQQELRCLYYPGILVDHFEFGSGKSQKARRVIEERRYTFLERWRAALIDAGHAKSESSAANDIVARRLLPRPRRLVILDGSDVDTQTISDHLRPDGTTTIYLSGCTEQDAVSFAKRFAMQIEFGAGTSESDFQNFMERRKGFYDEVFTVGQVDQLTAQS